MTFSELLNLVLAGDDQAIEFARDEVTPHAVELEKHYWKLSGWMQKYHMVSLLQDQANGLVENMMWDFLSAPWTDPTHAAWEALVPQNKAIAICHVKNDFSVFSTYNNDTTLLRKEVEALLAERNKTGNWFSRLFTR